jgi:hypothetical protein
MPTSLLPSPTVRSSPKLPELSESGGVGSVIAQPISAPHTLSSLQTRVQEQIQLAFEGQAGDGGPPIGDYCPNHHPKLSQPSATPTWLEVGSPPEWRIFTRSSLFESKEFYVGQAAGIGRASAFCVNLLQEPKMGTPIQLDIVKPDGSYERLSYIHGALSQEGRQRLGLNDPKVIEFNDGTTTTRIGPLDYAYSDGSDTTILVPDKQSLRDETAYTFIYFHHVGEALGKYHISLIIDKTEIAQRDLEVSTCDCPTVLIDPREASGNPVPFTTKSFRNGDTLKVAYTGFRPGEQIVSKLFRVRGAAPRGLTDVEGAYEWPVKLNDRGESLEVIRIDDPVVEGDYILAHFSNTEQGLSCLTSLPGQICRAPSTNIAINMGTTVVAPLTGMRIVAIAPVSPAAEAGLQVGWILISLNGRNIENVAIARDVATQNSGRPVEAIVWDGSVRHTVNIVPRNGLLGADLCALTKCGQ